MKIILKRENLEREGNVGWGSQFVAENEGGAAIRIAGSPEIGHSDQGLRPMQALLASLAGCSAMDVLMILQKQKHVVTRLDVEVDGIRADAVPAVFTKIHLHYIAAGDMPLHKLERAVALSSETYCSVSHMLRHTVEITTSCGLVEG
jgi:putative redox protein